MPNINDILIYNLETSSLWLQISSQVYYHRWLFADPVKPSWCITGLVEPPRSTNQNYCYVKLLPMSILTYFVGYVHLCHLLGAPQHCLCPKVRENLFRIAYPFTHPLIQGTCDITGVVKHYLKTSSNILCDKVCYETIAIAT